MPKDERLNAVEFTVAAEPTVGFKITKDSTQEDFVGAIAVAGVVATGKLSKATLQEVAFCNNIGQRLLEEADERWGLRTSDKMALAIVYAVLVTRAAEAKYGGPKAAKARLAEIGSEALMAEVGISMEDAVGTLAREPGLFNLEDEIL